MSRIRKAVYPALIVLIGVIIHALKTGEWDEPETIAAIADFVLALLVYAIPNEEPNA